MGFLPFHCISITQAQDAPLPGLGTEYVFTIETGIAGTIGNDAFYFRTSPKFVAPNGKYGWMNNTVFVSAIRFSPAKPDVVVIDVYKVL